MLVDTHAHLSFSQFQVDLADVLARAQDADVAKVVVVGTQLDSSREAIALSECEPVVWATAGFHPADSEAVDDAGLKDLAVMLTHSKVVAVGETGLDHFRDYAPHDVQEAAFRAHIRLAREMGLPLIIHSRAAEDRVMDVLQEEKASDVGGVLHCFGGTRDQAQRAVDFNFHLGFGGIVTYKNADALSVALSVPKDRLLLETDCPFLAPVPKRGKRNEPAFVRHVAEAIVAGGSMTFEALCDQTTANAHALFGLVGETA